MNHMNDFHRIMLIEDNPDDIYITREILDSIELNYELITAQNGEEALMILNREGKFASASHPDIILLDLNLPGLEGRKVLSAIKSSEKTRAIPVLVLTTSSSQEDTVFCYRNHANCYMKKPLDITEFKDLLLLIKNFWLQTVILPENI